MQASQAYDELQETIALLKQINFSERSLNQKGVLSLDEEFDASAFSSCRHTSVLNEKPTSTQGKSGL